MKPETAAVLSSINERFYASTTALEFSRSRRAPWGGWERVVHRLPRAPSVLDVGCGDGRFAAYLAKHRLEVSYLGLDASQPLLDMAQERALGPWARFKHGDFLADPLGLLGSFDLIGTFGVLHHVAGQENRTRLLKWLGSQLAPGGCLALTVWRFDRDPAFERRVLPWRDYNQRTPRPVPAADLEAGDVLLRWGVGDGLRYCHFPQEAELENLFRATGLRVAERYMADGRGERLNEYFLLVGD